MAWSAVTVVGMLAGVLALALAIAVLLASRTGGNRWLAALLVVEGVLQASVVLVEEYGEPLALQVLSLAAIVLAPALTLAVLRPLGTPAVRFLRPRAALAAVFGVSLALFAAVNVAAAMQRRGTIAEEHPVAAALWVILFAYLAGVYVFSLVASVSAFRRARPGTLARARAKAFAFAFGVRDVGFGAFLLVIIALDVANARSPVNLDAVPAVATLLYLVLLAYGILRTQLFDIDLKLKVGISKSTVVTLGLVAVLAAAKVAEFYLNKTYGFVAGGIAAGMMLVLAPRLNKLGDKVAAAALPQADGSAAYVASRKLEVYRAAVESAWEDGNISMGDRSILDRLREKLEISGPEAFEVEADVAKGLRRAA